MTSLARTVAVFALFVSPAAVAAAKTALEIGPGPAEILDSERAIVADPERGIEHAVVLVEESEWRERIGGVSEISHHLRAKILSNEARSLADIEMPRSLGNPRIRRWWARTLLPDGTVLELPRDRLAEQTVAKTRRTQVRTLRAALAGVEPGCVIDYGYEVAVETLVSDRTIVLQHDWPVLEWRYRWLPDRRLGAAFAFYKNEGLDLKFEKGSNAVLAIGNRLPAVPAEPFMPPEEAVRASVTLYYMSESYATPEKYWRATARRLSRATKTFNADSRILRRTLASIEGTAEGDLQSRLRAAYDWIGERIDNTRLRTAEQIEFEDDDESRRERNTNTWVLETKTAKGWQLDRLFLGMARELGAEADLVLVMNREFGLWKDSYMEWRQFDDALVAVREPGQAIEEAIFVDPGSGLPYGEVPWFLAGSTGMLVATKDYEPVVVPFPGAAANTTRSTATVEFEEDNSVMYIDWARDYGPQDGLLWRRELRRLAPRDRDRRLLEICGDSVDFEVDTAEAPGLDRPAGALRVECSGESLTRGFSGRVASYHLTVDGLWNLPLMDLSPGRRLHPVVLDHPRVELSTLDIRPPAGFETTAEPERKEIKSPFGRYALEIEATETGYRVQRALALSEPMIAPERYGEFVDFLAGVRQADGTSVEFRRVAP